MKKRTKVEGLKQIPLLGKLTLDVQGVQQIHTFNGGAASPASGRYTAGLRTSLKPAPGSSPAMQSGTMRPR